MIEQHADARSGLSHTGPLIDPTAEVRNCAFGAFTEVGARTQIAETSMGDYSYVVNDSEIINCDIGKFCSIAAHTRLNPGNHPMHRASQSHFTYRSSLYFDGKTDDTDFFDWRRAHQVTLGHDVWIGHGAVILPGVCIGTGAVIAAGAVVSKDVGNYTIVAGVPAKPIRRRFGERMEDALLTIAWWDWPHDLLRRRLSDFRTLPIEMFVEKYR